MLPVPDAPGLNPGIGKDFSAEISMLLKLINGAAKRKVESVDRTHLLLVLKPRNQ